MLPVIVLAPRRVAGVAGAGRRSAAGPRRGRRDEDRRRARQLWRGRQGVHWGLEAALTLIGAEARGPGLMHTAAALRRPSAAWCPALRRPPLRNSAVPHACICVPRPAGRVGGRGAASWHDLPGFSLWRPPLAHPVLHRRPASRHRCLLRLLRHGAAGRARRVPDGGAALSGLRASQSALRRHAVGGRSREYMRGVGDAVVASQRAECRQLNRRRRLDAAGRPRCALCCRQPRSNGPCTCLPPGPAQREDYGPAQPDWYLLQFKNCTNCSLSGGGTIDGRGRRWVLPPEPGGAQQQQHQWTGVQLGGGWRRSGTRQLQSQRLGTAAEAEEAEAQRGGAKALPGGRRRVRNWADPSCLKPEECRWDWGCSCCCQVRLKPLWQARRVPSHLHLRRRCSRLPGTATCVPLLPRRAAAGRAWWAWWIHGTSASPACA